MHYSSKLNGGRNEKGIRTSYSSRKESRPSSNASRIGQIARRKDEARIIHISIQNRFSVNPDVRHAVQAPEYEFNPALGSSNFVGCSISAAAAQTEPSSPPASRCSRTWAMLIKRVYEVDPLACPHCGGEMKVVAFIEPPQAEVIEQILRHCGLWQDRPSSRAPPDVDELAQSLDTCYAGSQAGVPQPVQAQEPTYVDIDTFLATF